MLRKRIISVIEYLFFLSIGILLLWLSVRKLDLSAIWDDIQQAHSYPQSVVGSRILSEGVLVVREGAEIV